MWGFWKGIGPWWGGSDIYRIDAVLQEPLNAHWLFLPCEEITIIMEPNVVASWLLTSQPLELCVCVHTYKYITYICYLHYSVLNEMKTELCASIAGTESSSISDTISLHGFHPSGPRYRSLAAKHHFISSKTKGKGSGSLPNRWVSSLCIASHPRTAA